LLLAVATCGVGYIVALAAYNIHRQCKHAPNNGQLSSETTTKLGIQWSLPIAKTDSAKRMDSLEQTLVKMTTAR
jgi:hypothetical protein